MEISDDKFSVLWGEISEALVRIAGQISPAKAKEWQNAIDTFLKDPLTEEDKRNEQELQCWYQNDTEVKEYFEKVESSVKHLEKYLEHEVREQAQEIKDELGGKVESTVQEVQHLGQELRDEAQDIKDQLGGKVESTVQEVQHLGQELRDEAQDIKDQLGGKVESTAQEVQCLRQELRDVAQDIKDRLELGVQPNSSAGGQLVYFFFKVKYFSSNTGTYTIYQGYLCSAHCYMYLDRNGFVHF